MANRLLTGARPYFLLALLCLGFFVPGIAAMPPTDRDEARYVQATRQMLDSGDFINIRFLDEPRNKKPAGIYWAQAASVAAFSDAGSRALWPYRIPSVLGALAAVLLTFWGGTALFGPRVAFLGAALLGTCLLLTIEAHIAKTDAALLGAVALSQAALARIWMRVKDGWSAPAGHAAALWVGVGLGALIKGPIGPMVAALTIVALKLSRRDAPLMTALRPGWGLPLALAIFAPWLVAITLWGESSFVRDAVGQDLLPKLIGGQESHGFPPGYFLLLMPFTFWPASLFVWPALVWAWTRRHESGVLFCLAWLVPSWLVFEIVPTKLPNYILPVYPALALLVGAALMEAVEAASRTRLRRIVAKASYAGWAGIALGFGVFLFVLGPVTGGPVSPWAAGALIAGLAGGAAGLWLAWHGRPVRAVAVGMACALPLFGAAFQGVLPAADALWLSPRAQALVAAHSPDGAVRPVVAGGYREPSLVFMLGTDTALPSEGGLVDAFAARPNGLALMGTDVADRFVADAHARGITLHALGAVRGFNYSKGKWDTLTLYERAR